MADDKSKRGPQDRTRISLTEDYEVQYWTKKFDITKPALVKLVLENGNSVKKVQEALKKKKKK